MKTLFVLMNHELLPIQDDDAKKSLHVNTTVILSDEAWSHISPESETIQGDLSHYKECLSQQAKKGDFLLVQGDFGATYNMIRFARTLGMTPIYATTKRLATEEIVGGKVITKREFVHVRFRHYEEA